MDHLPPPENEGAAAIADRHAISSGHGIPFGAAVRVWAKIAALSFGGPAGQIAVMHRILVEEKRWMDVELAASSRHGTRSGGGVTADPASGRSPTTISRSAGCKVVGGRAALEAT